MPFHGLGSPGFCVAKQACGAPAVMMRIRGKGTRAQEPGDSWWVTKKSRHASDYLCKQSMRYTLVRFIQGIDSCFSAATQSLNPEHFPRGTHARDSTALPQVPTSCIYLSSSTLTWRT